MRCDRCQFWSDVELPNEYPAGYKKKGKIGLCVKPVYVEDMDSDAKQSEMGLFDQDGMSAALYTTHNFGCVAFKERNK